MNDTPDQTLIERCLGGDTPAFGLLVERYQHRLYASLIHVTGSAEAALDVSQDAFLQAFEKLDSFRGQSQFYSWLFRIALNAALSSRRKKMRRVTMSVEALREVTGQEPIDPHPQSAPSQSLELSERQRLVQRALLELSEEFRTPLVLKEMEDLRYEDIAVVLDIPLGTVRSRIHRARQELRSKLEIALRREDDG